MPRLRLVPALLLTLGVSASSALPARADAWVQPTAEELSMTSAPEAPGAPAIYLLREQITEDNLHMYSVHGRIKVLTDAGKDQSNIEIQYLRGSYRVAYNVDEVAGRTIHPDGTVIPFTGKPYEKLIVKQGGKRYMAKVFSLPDVTPGSILEYRYKIRYDDSIVFAPDWYVQDQFFTRKVHYQWKPTERMLTTGGEREQTVSTIAWAPILPVGAEVKRIRDPQQKLTLELTANNIPAIAHEEHMAPLNSFSYRVLFYYTPYHTSEEFWKSEGKYWAKKEDRFIGPGNGIKAAVNELVAPSDTPEQKLHKLYAAVQKMENTDDTRSHTSQENKTEGVGEIHSADDVWRSKRGSGDQLTEVFLGLARAAGFKAYPAMVTRRDRSFFFSQFLNIQQLDDELAIVNVNGKEQFFDPGVRFCPYGQLAPQHLQASGIRETDGGSELVTSPAESYKVAHMTRVGDLTMDEHGVVSGTLTLTYGGSPALHWRHLYAETDEPEVRHRLTEHLEHLLPGGMSVKLSSLTALQDPEQPLVAKFEISGAAGSPTGKRLLVPADLFESSNRSEFPHEKRETPIAFDYPTFVQDAVRIKLPANMAVESMPTEQRATLKNAAAYALTTQSQPSSFLIRRDFILGEVLYPVSQYADLRKFFQSMETSDQQTVVLKLNASGGAEKASIDPAH